MVDAYDNWPQERPDDRRLDERLERRPSRRPEPRLEQRLDQWVSAGRQLVDGVSGARPGSRPGGRSSGLKLDHLGRWVEDKLDWLLEDEEGWRESWEQPPGQPAQTQPKPEPQRRTRRQPLEAISRRGQAAPQDWPEDDSFTLQRWQRGTEGRRAAPEPEPAVAPQSGRMLPRSTRRRFD